MTGEGLAVICANGRAAFLRGDLRIVPRDILVDHGTDAARAWYRGWDTENLMADWDTVPA